MFSKFMPNNLVLKEIVNCVCWHLIPFTIQTKKVKEIVSFR